MIQRSEFLDCYLEQLDFGGNDYILSSNQTDIQFISFSSLNSVLNVLFKQLIISKRDRLKCKVDPLFPLALVPTGFRSDLPRQGRH